MSEKNLLVISNSYPNLKKTYVQGIFVNEQIKYLKDFFDNVYVISPVAYGVERLRKTTFQDYQYDNVKVFFPKYVNFPFLYNWGRSLWITLETRAIMSVIKREMLNFNLIHAHFTWPSGAVAVRLKKLFNVPVIITEGSSTTLHYELRRMNRYYIDTYHQSDIIIRNNIKDIPLFIKSGIDRNKIYHVEYGYDKKKYFPIPKNESRKMIGIASRKRIILNIGRLSDEKGQKYLIEAMNCISKKNPDVICYIGGTGPSHDLLQKQIVELHLENNVKLIGFIPDESMSLWMNTADLFVLPSLTEGNPTVMFECLGCGIPFIGTRVGGVPEVINSDDYGLLVDPGNSNDLAEKILIGLEREWDRKKILQYADQYSSEKISKQIMSIYDSISNRESS